MHEKDPERSCFRIEEVPVTPALADVAWTGMYLLCRPTGTLADLAMGPMIAYGPTRDDGRWLHEQR